MKRFCAALAAFALVPAAPASGAVYLTNARPHSDLVLRDRGVRIARFETSARGRGGRVLVVVRLTARSRDRDVSAVLRVGRCTGGPSSFPVCEPNAGRKVVLYPDRTALVRFTVNVPRPRRGVDAIRVSLTPPGKVVRPYRSPQVAIADMLLPARAWTAYPDRAFGLRVYQPWESGENLRTDVHSVVARTAQMDPELARATLAWTISSDAETEVQTLVSACGGTGQCEPRTGETTIPAGRDARFFARPVLRRAARPAIWSFFARSAGGVLFNVTMPWPRVA